MCIRIRFFSVNPYSGAPYKRLPSRYVLSPFPVFLSVVSSLCGGLHPAIVAHVVFPAVFLPIAFYVCFLFGRRWFPGEKDAQGIYMVLIAVLLWFSGYSIYNGGNFQMVRIWQGKALLAAAFLPLTIYLCLSVMLSEKPEYSWKMLFMANISCCLLSSMGILLAPLAVGIFLILSIIRFRNLDNAAKGSLCCLPSIILGFVYILIR